MSRSRFTAREFRSDVVGFLDAFGYAVFFEFRRHGNADALELQLDIILRSTNGRCRNQFVDVPAGDVD